MSSTQEVGDIFGAGKGAAQAMLRSPTVLIVAIGLWGMNLFFFKLFGIDYKYVLTYDLVQMELEEERERRLQGDQQHFSNSSHTNDGVAGGGGGGSGDTGPKPKKRKNTDPSPDEEEDGDEETTKKLPSSAVSATTASTKAASSTTTTPTSVDLSAAESHEIQLLTTTSNTAAAELQQIQNDNASQYYYGMSINGFKLVVFSVVLLFLLHFTTHFWMDHLGKSVLGAVFFFYFAVVVYIFLPFPSNQWLRRAFVMVLQRCFELVNPRCSCIFLDANTIPRKIPFVDVFFADAMCSLSKVFFDWGMLLHQASHFPDPVPAAAHNIILPSLCAAVPYMIRARQCLIMHTVGRLKQDPKRYQHMMNAFKYSTSLFPLVLSAYQKTLSDENAANRLQGPLIALLM